MSTRTQAFILLLFGGVLVRLGTSDALLRFVRPYARIWVVLAGVAFVALGAWSLVADRRADTDADADGRSHTSRTGWLILAPIIALLVVAPPALGTFTAARTPASIAKPADTAFPALPGRAPHTDPLTDFAARAIWDDGRTLTGQSVRLTGFVAAVTADHRTGAPTFVLTRLVITCCAADARPIYVGITTAATPPAAGTWLQITGTYGGVSPYDAQLPVLNATAVDVVHAPADPYD